MRSRQIDWAILGNVAKASLKDCHLQTASNSGLELLFGGEIRLDVCGHAAIPTISRSIEKRRARRSHLSARHFQAQFCADPEWWIVASTRAVLYRSMQNSIVSINCPSHLRGLCFIGRLPDVLFAQARERLASGAFDGAASRHMWLGEPVGKAWSAPRGAAGATVGGWSFFASSAAWILRIGGRVQPDFGLSIQSILNINGFFHGYLARF